MSNCGLDALRQMTALKRVSMFSLIHLAKDNGINLYFCKVEPEELLLVKRPAIFHQKDHFVFIENGNPMPGGEYTGYVLTEKAIHEPLPFTLAKKIYGSKKWGKPVQWLSPIITGIASIINPVLGAAVGAGMGAWGVSSNPAMKGQWWRIPLGGATGYLQGASGATFGIDNAVLAGGLAAGGEIPTALKTGDWSKPLTAGIGQWAGAKFIQGAGQGLSAGLANQQGLVSSANTALKSGVNNLMGGSLGGTTNQGASTAGSLASGGPAPLGTASAGYTAPGIATPAGYAGSLTVPGVSNALGNLGAQAGQAASGGFGSNWSIGSLLKGVSGGTGGGTAAQAASGGGNVFGTLGLGAKDIIGGVAGMLVPSSSPTSDTTSEMNKAQQYYQNEWNTLPQTTRDQLTKYVNTPISDLAKEFAVQDERGLRLLAEQYDDQKTRILRMYAEAGQDPMSSSDAQKQLADLDMNYNTAISEHQLALQNKALEQAISVKKDVFAQSVQQQNADYGVLKDLATAYGKDAEFEDAIKSQNTQALRNLIAIIFSGPTATAAK